MRVALYYPWVYLFGGPERTITQILARSRHHWTVFTNRYEPDATFPSLRNARIVALDQVSVNRSMTGVCSAAWKIARQKLPLEDHDLLVVFCEGLGDLTLIRNRSIPAACLCFTPLRAAFDPYYQREYLARNGGRWWRSLILHAGAGAFRWIDRRLWKRYRRVFAISGEVRRRIERGGLRDAGEVPLLYPGVEVEPVLEPPVYSRDFLIPGRIMWTKNLELAIEAFQVLRARRPDLDDFTLTFAGYVDRKSRPYLDALRKRAAGCDRIRFVVAPSDEELFTLCRSAYAVLYPPFNEDWGLVPLECMAAAKPVIAVNRGGPSESVVDGETGYLVDPVPEAFAEAMERLARDPALVREMGARARRRAAEFSWTRFCAALDDQLEQAVAEAAGGSAPAAAPAPAMARGRS